MEGTLLTSLFCSLFLAAQGELMGAELKQPSWTQRCCEDESFQVEVAQSKTEPSGSLMMEGHPQPGLPTSRRREHLSSSSYHLRVWFIDTYSAPSFALWTKTVPVPLRPLLVFLLLFERIASSKMAQFFYIFLPFYLFFFCFPLPSTLFLPLFFPLFSFLPLTFIEHLLCSGYHASCKD